MLTVEVELLTGTYTATHFNDRHRPEWPPHPARIYSALVNAWADSDEPDPAEADALRWFEGQGDPSIACSVLTDDERSEVAVRSATTHFVPVNDPAVVRDLSAAYARLVESEAELVTASASGDDKAILRASKARDKARDKALADSTKAASHGEAPTTALALLPDNRGKQGRSYPTVRPADRVAAFTWPEAEPDAPTAAALDGLLARVGRLGHSSSLVSCRIVETSAEATYVPHEDGQTLVRLPGAGQLDRLQELFASHQGRDPRQLPSRMVRYGQPATGPTMRPRSVLGGVFIAATIEGPKLSVRSSLPVARAVRNAIISHAGHDGAAVPELISGHRPRPAGSTASTPSTDRTHMAVVPLPFVGHPHADGLLKGVAIVVPRDADQDEYQVLLGAVGRWLQADRDAEDRTPNLWGPALGDDRWAVERASVDQTPVTLRRSRWTTAATTWVTVTPLVLDRYPDGLWRGSPAKRARAEAQAIASIATSCTNIGLPEPASVEIRSDAPLHGVAPLRRYPQFRNGPSDAPRPAVHAVIEFGQPVLGPVILGRGRHLGQGLCFPLREDGDG